MIRYIFKRLLFMIPVFITVSIITFLLSNLGAGDAARMLAEKKYDRPTNEQIENVREEYGLNEPITEQYFKWLGKVVKGNFGESYKTGKSVSYELVNYFPNTIKIAVTALIITIMISVPMGIVSAIKTDSIYDLIARIISFVSVSVPTFWVGLLLLYILGTKFKVISVLNGGSNSVLIPSLTLAFGSIGVSTRMMRESMGEVISKGYMKAAKSKGISNFNLYFKHGLKNAILPVIAKLGMTFSGFLCGTSIIESIFSIQGIGKYALDAVISKDIPVIEGYVMLMAAVVVVVNLIVDIIYSLIDPRIRIK